MRIFGKFFISTLTYLFFLLPGVSWAEEQKGGAMEISFNIYSNGDFSSNAKKAILKEKPEAKNIEEDSDDFGFAIRTSVNMPITSFNFRFGAAIDIGGAPSVSYEAKRYYWSSQYSSEEFAGGLIFRLLLTTDYFILGNAYNNTGLAFSAGLGFGAILEEEQEDLSRDTESEDYGGLSYEYGLRLSIPLATNTNLSLSAMKAQVVRSSEFSWKSNMFTIGINARF